MSRKAKREQKVKSKIFSKLIVVALFLGIVYFIMNVAPNYVNNEITDRANLVINNNNITKSLKKDVIIENGVIYISMEDIENFFDPYIYYDEKYNQIITTSESQVASIVVGENTMENNGAKISIASTVIERDDTYYIPFSTLKDVYNVEINYIESTNTVTVDSKNRKYAVADSTKDNNVKAYPTVFSRNVNTVEQGGTVTVVQNAESQNEEVNGWTEVRTDTGKLGYVKSNTLANEYVYRETMEETSQIEGKVSMVWDYFSEYRNAPDRSETSVQGVNVVSPTFFTLVNEGQGRINENVGTEGEAYISWAHENGYKVWPSLSNNSYIASV